MQEPKKDESYRRGYQTGYQEGEKEAEKKLIKFVSWLSALEEEIAKIKKFLII